MRTARPDHLKLPPGQQAQRLKQYRTGLIFRRTFQDRGEFDRLRRLPRRELRRLLAVNGAGDAETSKPDYLSDRTWKRWKALEPYERERLLRLVRTGGDLRSVQPSPERERQRRGRVDPGRSRAREEPRASPETRRRSPRRAPRDSRPRHSPTAGEVLGVGECGWTSFLQLNQSINRTTPALQRVGSQLWLRADR